MRNLIVKNVDVFGDTIVAAQDAEGNIWAGVKWFCEGLGLTEDQIKNERKKIQKDLVLKEGVSNLTLLTNGGLQEVLCLGIDFVPLWLAKISITPNMKETNPELVEKLVKYQLKAKDVLAEAFLPKRKKMSALELLELHGQAILEVNEKVENVEQRVDRLEYDVPLYAAEADELCQAVKKKGTQLLGGKKSNAYKNSKLRDSVYRNIYNAIKYQFDLRDSSGKYKSYKALQRKHFSRAMELVKEYDLPIFLKEKVENENAQINLEVA